MCMYQNDMEVCVDLSNFPPSLRYIQSTILFRGDYRDICTDVLKKIPAKSLAKKIEECGISAALCFAVIHSYPEDSVCNFRQLNKNELVFTVEKEGQFSNDVRHGKAEENIHKIFRNEQFLAETQLINDLRKIKIEFKAASNIDSKQRKETPLRENLKPKQDTHHQHDAPPKHKTPPKHETPPKQSYKTPPPLYKERNPKTTDLFTETTVTETIGLDLTPDRMSSFFIEEDAERLWQAKNYKEAFPALQQCLPIATKHDRPILQLKIALCMHELERSAESNRLISQALQYVKDNQPPPSRCTTIAETYRKVGECYTEKRSYSRALWIFTTSASLFEASSDSDNGAIGIANCITNIRMLQDGKTHSFQLTQMIISTLHKLVESLKNLSCSNHTKIDSLASSYRQLASAYSSESKAKEAARYNEHAIDLLYDKFGDKAEEHFNYGVCTHNLAACIGDMGRHEEAKRMFHLALERQRRATDWPDEESRQKSIKLTQRALNK
ncbi:uncharacterized protein LOC100179117 isoform X2 [Ciona intestinalis]